MNRTNKGANTNMGMLFTDVITIALAFASSLLIWYQEITVQALIKLFVFICLYLLIFLLCCKSEYLYNVTLFYYLDRVYKKVTRAFLVAMSATFLMIYIALGTGNEMRFYFTFLVISYFLICLKVVVYRKISGEHLFMKSPRTAFVGSVESFEKFFYFLDKTSIHLQNVGYIIKSYDPCETDDENRYIGKIENLETLIKKHHLDQIYFIQQNPEEISDIQPHIDLCEEMGITVRVIVDFYKKSGTSSYVSSVGTYPIITFHTISLNPQEQMIKRFIDILAGLVGLTIFAPLMFLVAVCVKLDSPGPVIFKQKRLGQNGRIFYIYKFRSMYIDAEKRKAEMMQWNEMKSDQGLMFKMKDDPRITRVGKFIRKYSLDEIPQFFNVLKGDMSLVGTRPPTMDEVEKYNREQWRRISIQPGLTGMWQVNGRSQISSFDEVVKMDVFYIENWSLFLDIKIILKTIGVMFSGKGAC